MIMNAFIAMTAAFFVSAFLTSVLIPYLRRLKFGQQERAEGLKSHLKKAGTPTMGGLAFIPAAVLCALPFALNETANFPVIMTMAGFGVIGFLDDYMKVVRKNTKGLSPALKMVGQFVVSSGLLLYILNQPDATSLIIPFTGGKELDINWLYIPFFYIFVLGTDNGVNFTDGVDGLCTSVTGVVAAFFIAAAIMAGNGMESVSGAVLGALLGYLLFNLHPASVFMGDTGSLALGGYVAAISACMKMPLFIIIVGFIYLAEMLSVMIQVAYFKKTGGKRIFRMAPIHHHFEMGGWSETQVVGRFTALTVILCGVGLLAL